MPRWWKPRWRKPRLRKPWDIFVAVYDDDLDRERRLTYKHIDEGPFGWLSVFVAGAGFLTDIYAVVAGYITLPMLGIVYWEGEIPRPEETAINLALLVGMLIGQITFGVLADRYGRKGVYGIALIIIMGSTVGLALSSRGEEGSIHIFPWLIAWKLLMGFGIGGDFPLSAVITAEFAPRRHRANMLAAVFLMKPVGEILAILVAIVAIARNRRHLSDGADSGRCVGECLQAMDNIWRWIVGVGAILPAGALMLRLQIPESLRYTLEVEKDINTARDYRTAQSQLQPTENGINESTPGGQPAPVPLDNGLYSHHPQGSGTRDAFELLQDPPNHGKQISPRLPIEVPIASTPSRSSIQAASVRIGPVHEHEVQTGSPPVGSYRNSVEQASQNERLKVRKETWGEFWKGFRIFLFTERKWSERKIRDGHWMEGSWTDLAGTSLAWMLVDISFYFIGVFNPETLSILWGPPQNTAVYSVRMEYCWRALISNSIGALVGGAIFIAVARFRYNLQLYGFLMLAVLSVALGATLLTLSNGRYFAATIVFYGWCRLFFNLGPNPSVFIIPAEVFPTRYRCTCHGISAAVGKLGSLLAQWIAKSKNSSPAWLGRTILILTICDILGAVITKFWVPNPCDISGESRRLEDLSDGKDARKKLEAEELEMRRAPV